MGLVTLGFALFLDCCCWGLLLWQKVRLLEGAKIEVLSNYYYKLPRSQNSLEDPAMLGWKVEGCFLNDLASRVLKAGDIHES